MKEQVLGTFDSLDKAQLASTLAEGFGPLLGGGKTISLETRTSYQLVAKVNGKINGTVETATFECRYGDGRTFATDRGRSRHYTEKHSKKRKK